MSLSRALGEGEGKGVTFRDLENAVAPFDSSDETLLTVREAAAYLRCSRATLFRFLQRGELPGFKVGQKTVVYLRDVRSLVRAREVASGVPDGSVDEPAEDGSMIDSRAN